MKHTRQSHLLNKLGWTIEMDRHLGSKRFYYKTKHGYVFHVDRPNPILELIARDRFGSVHSLRVSYGRLQWGQEGFIGISSFGDTKFGVKNSIDTFFHSLINESRKYDGDNYRKYGCVQIGSDGIEKRGIDYSDTYTRYDR